MGYQSMNACIRNIVQSVLMVTNVAYSYLQSKKHAQSGQRIILSIKRIAWAHIDFCGKEHIRI